MKGILKYCLLVFACFSSIIVFFSLFSNMEEEGISTYDVEKYLNLKIPSLKSSKKLYSDNQIYIYSYSVSPNEDKNITMEYIKIRNSHNFEEHLQKIESYFTEEAQKVFDDEILPIFDNTGTYYIFFEEKNNLQFSVYDYRQTKLYYILIKF